MMFEKMLMAVGHFELASIVKIMKFISLLCLFRHSKWLSDSKVKVPMLVSLDFVRILKFNRTVLTHLTSLQNKNMCFGLGLSAR